MYDILVIPFVHTYKYCNRPTSIRGFHLNSRFTKLWNLYYLRYPCISYTVRTAKKRKPRFISMRYQSLPSHIMWNKLYAVLLSRAFSLLSFDGGQTTIMISQCMNEREQFKLMHVKNDLRRIMVLSNMTKFRLANPCQNKESKQKKHDKRWQSEIQMNVFQHVPFVLKRGRPR